MADKSAATYHPHNTLEEAKEAEPWKPCPLGVCCAPEGHDGTCDQASGWLREEEE
jgi:hypothetical protein